MKKITNEEKLFLKEHLENNPFDKKDLLFFDCLNNVLSDQRILEMLKLNEYKVKLWFPIQYQKKENYLVEKEWELLHDYSLKTLKEEIFPKTLFLLPIKNPKLKDIQYEYNFTTFEVNNYFYSFNKDWVFWTNKPINPNVWDLLILAVANNIKAYTEEERKKIIN